MTRRRSEHDEFMHEQERDEERAAKRAGIPVTALYKPAAQAIASMRRREDRKQADQGVASEQP